MIGRFILEFVVYFGEAQTYPLYIRRNHEGFPVMIALNVRRSVINRSSLVLYQFRYLLEIHRRRK